MRDLKSPRLMYVKAGLLVIVGVLAAIGLLIEAPSWRVAALLAASIWGFSRAYYFLFYVIERWIDPRFKFAGLGSAAAYLLRRGRK